MIITNSQMEKSLLSNTLSIPKDKFKVVHNGFDANLFEIRNKKVEYPSVIPKNWGSKYVHC